MDLQAQLIEAFTEELKRQAEVSEGRLTVNLDAECVEVRGVVDLAALAMTAAGAVAGGP